MLKLKYDNHTCLSMDYKLKILKSLNGIQRKFFYYFQCTWFTMQMDCVSVDICITQMVWWYWIMYNSVALYIDNMHKVKWYFNNGLNCSNIISNANSWQLTPFANEKYDHSQINILDWQLRLNNAFIDAYYTWFNLQFKLCYNMCGHGTLIVSIYSMMYYCDVNNIII